MGTFVQRGKKVKKKVAHQAQSHNDTLLRKPPQLPTPPSPSRNTSKHRGKRIRYRTPPSSPVQPSSPLQPQSSSPLLQPQSPQAQDKEPTDSEAYDISRKKRKREKSRGKGVHDMIEANDGKKVPVVFDVLLEVPENVKVSANLSSEIGSIVRIHAPVRYMGWRNVPQVDKKLMHEKLLVLFEIELTNPKIKEYVDQKMAKSYCVFKWRLFRHYKEYETPQEGRTNPPHFDLWNGRPDSHWHWLCDKVYTAKDFLDLSQKNTENRKKQKFHHKGGARPFIQHAKKATMGGAQFSMIDNWKNLYKDKNNEWVHDIAREKYDEMQQMREECKEKLIAEAAEGTPHDSVCVPLDVELEIMSNTLGRKGRFISSVGSFPRMESSKSFATSSLVLKSELDGTHDQLKLLTANFEIMQKENEQLKALVKSLSTSQGNSSSDSGEPDNCKDNDDLFADDEYYDELGDYDRIYD